SEASQPGSYYSSVPSTSCAIQSGSLKCWGDGQDGMLGNGSLTDASSPVTVSVLGNQVSDVALGGSHSCAIDNGAAFCWGNNYYQQLGSASYGEKSTVPVAVPG